MTASSRSKGKVLREWMKKSEGTMRKECKRHEARVLGNRQCACECRAKESEVFRQNVRCNL